MIDIETNIGEFRSELESRVAAIDNDTKSALSAAAQSLFDTSKNELTRSIYNKKIPKRKRSGKPGWRRTFQLLRAERLAVLRGGNGFQVFTDPSSPAKKYAEARHNLDRPSPIDGKTRSAPWRSEAVKKGQKRAADIFREALTKILS